MSKDGGGGGGVNAAMLASMKSHDDGANGPNMPSGDKDLTQRLMSGTVDDILKMNMEDAINPIPKGGTFSGDILAMGPAMEIIKLQEGGMVGDIQAEGMAKLEHFTPTGHGATGKVGRGFAGKS
jgi:hypothetical protein